MNVGSRELFVENAQNLPYDAEVEWIQSTGYNYINTGITGGTSAKWELDFEVVQWNGSGGSDHLYEHIIGAQTSPGVKPNIPKVYHTIYNSEHVLAFQTIDKTEYVRAEIGIRYLASVDANGICSFNGQSFLFSRFPNGFGKYEWWVCNCNLDSSFGCSIIKIFGLKMWKDHVLVIDCIPVVKEGVGVLFNRVNNEFLTNVGTGTFVIGPVKK